MGMRTAIYVFEPSTVTIRATDSGRTTDSGRANDSGEVRVTLCRFNRKAEQVALGTRQLEPGVYLLISTGGVEVNGGHISVVPLPRDKDIPPEPKFQASGLEQGASVADIQKFFTVAKGIEVGEAPPAATAKITDDPDGI